MYKSAQNYLANIFMYIKFLNLIFMYLFFLSNAAVRFDFEHAKFVRTVVQKWAERSLHFFISIPRGHEKHKQKCN